jgi:cephalosporin hydroxylase
MFPLWDAAIAPVLRAAGAQRVLEIGAFRGETTKLTLDFLEPDAELHVVDPTPSFDPAEPQQRFPGRYHFHPDLSLRVLPELPPMDVALIDGDHNWYTVHSELQMLARVCAAAGTILPILIMHDVGWPYGRRDLYYAPDQIPDEFRQPYRRAGMKPGTRELVETGGINPTMCNAELEGGPRNGVMTALEDFLAEYGRPVRKVIVPVFFGLAIVVDEDRLAQRPELGDTLDRIEGTEASRELLAVAESGRLRAQARLHGTIERSHRRLGRAASRYLGILKGALLDEHYLENEIRLKYLAKCAATGEEVEPDRVRDPVRAQPGVYEQLLRRRRAGASVAADTDNGFLPYSTIGRTRLDHLERCLEVIRTDAIAGDLVECNTGRGGAGIFMRGYLVAHELDNRKVWIADEFRASPAPAKEAQRADESMGDMQADLNLVRDAFQRFDLLDGRVRFLVGTVDATLPESDIDSIALLRLGQGIGAAARSVLETMYPKLSIGGYVVIDDHADPACTRAVREFRSHHGINDSVETVDWSAVAWRKTDPVQAQPGGWRPTETPLLWLPLAPPAPPDAIDLSIVVVFYNMRREAARTLRSLSRAYQLDLDDVTYEVIAVDNGSDPDQRLGVEFVESFGSEFRYIDLADEARPSPAHALNVGIREGRGSNFALMIDGAHVLTPSVLHFGLKGLKTYEPAIVATQQWYVGPGQQGDAMSEGYDQAYEDRLFRRIGWPQQGYRLFDIGHFVGGRDWLDGLWESNCMFVSRAQLEQVGGFDENYSMAGGGFANLDLYERLGSSPDVTVVSIIGEGSFHQLHGGVSTNQADADERHSRIYGYREHFADLRGRRHRGPGKPIHYVGRIASPQARRTRARRLTMDIFGQAAPTAEPDGLPTSPVPIPEDLRSSFIDAVWRSLAWKRTTWLGRHIESAPTDLIAYQQAITSVRPHWIVETGTHDGARTLFLASICDLLDHGQVVSIGEELSEGLPLHPRITYLDGVADDDATLARVRGLVGASSTTLVVLGSRVHAEATRRIFAAYAPLVSVGSYLIVTDTIVNGNPVWTGFGPGPMEALKLVLQRHGEFFADPELERFGLTFNPGGFLKRSR